MVDKSSLRSNRGSKDTKKSGDPKQPAKGSSSRKAPAVKKSTSTSGSTGEMEDDKQLDNAAEDVDMKDDAQDPTTATVPKKPEVGKKTGADGDVEMGDGKAAGGGGDDKKDEAKEDPTAVAINGS